MMSISHYPKLKEIIMSLRESDNKYGNISLMISHFAYSIFVLIVVRLGMLFGGA